MKTLQRYDKLGKILVDYKLGRVQGRVLPLRLWLEPTNKCNLRCPLCPQSSPDRPKHGFMDPALYYRIIEQIKGHVHDINLSHRGESLFHENIVEFIEAAHRAGIKTRIHTNGTILTPELSERIIDAGLDFLSFSFDGFTAPVYEASRVGATFEETVSHIMSFLEIKKKKRASTPFTVIQVIKNEVVTGDHIMAHREEFLDRFSGLPLNKLYIKDPHNWGGNIQQSTAEKLALGQGYSPCTFCWYSLTILWDGTVVPCPQDFYGLLPLGNLNESSLIDIWRGERLTELRQKFVDRTIAGVHPCETCDRLFRPSFLGIPSVNMKEFMSENIIGYRHLQNVYRKKWQKTGK